MNRGYLNAFLLSVMTGVSFTASADHTATETDDAQAPVMLDEVSVTATRHARKTQDVPQAVSVIGQDRIEHANLFNVKDVVSGTPGVLIESKNGGYDARLIIRGAGLKAPYGIREIMVLRDGVPLTDPDSMTRLDWIDPQDMRAIEISKGPGNLYSAGAFGGAVQILSKSVFEEHANVARIGFGQFGSQNYHLRYGEQLSDAQAVAVTTSHRRQENDWRNWNEFESSNLGVKHGLILPNEGVLETELSYSEADLQLPGSMSRALFDEFRRTGKQKQTQDIWKHSGRYSQIWFFNTKYEQQLGQFTLKPRFYFNQWRHYHPVTGLINDSDWTRNFGTDLETEYDHKMGNVKAQLVAGVTYKVSGTDDSRKYTYRDIQTQLQSMPPPPRQAIVSTLSDERGQLASTRDFDHRLAGIFLQESFFLGDRWTIDIGGRFDRSEFESDENELIAFDYATRTYKTGDGRVNVDKDFNLPAPKLGASYKLTPAVSLWASAAQGTQVPSDSEIASNPDLDFATATMTEFGLKGRKSSWTVDASVYQIDVEDEIVTVRVDDENLFANAGQTDKKGLEFSGAYQLTTSFQAGLNYAFSDYEYDDFSETVRTGATTVNVDRSGNQLPFIPRHQYGVFADYEHNSGIRLRAQTQLWDKYYLDNANSETYSGYAVSHVSVAYAREKHTVALNVDNVFDRHYAMQVSKDTTGKLSYTAGTPRSATLNYSYQF